MSSELPTLKRLRSPGPAQTAPTDGEPVPHPWTSVAAWCIRFIAFGWIIQAAFGVAIGFDAMSNASSFAQAVGIAFHGIDSIFMSLTLAFCLMAASELSVMLARYLTRKAT